MLLNPLISLRLLVISAKKVVHYWYWFHSGITTQSAVTDAEGDLLLLLSLMNPFIAIVLFFSTGGFQTECPHFAGSNWYGVFAITCRHIFTRYQEQEKTKDTAGCCQEYKAK
jgi:hypothetical protein